MAHPTRTFQLGRTGSALGVDHIPIPDEDLAADMDEPPEPLHFSRQSVPPSPHPAAQDVATPKGARNGTRMCRSPSLLTQGLLTSPDLHSAALDTAMTRSYSHPHPHTLALDTAMARAHSTASTGTMSTAELTSDGGLTSPARTSTPSPPFPSTVHVGLALVPTKTLELEHDTHVPASMPAQPAVADLPATEPVAPRRRCITFACTQPKTETPEKPVDKKPAPPRKTCLKFACPLKPGRAADEPDKALAARRRCSPAPAKMLERRHRDSQSTIKDEKARSETPKAAAHDTPRAEPPATPTEKPATPIQTKKANNPDGLRFHEFAPHRPEEEGWITAGPTARQKITVNDTLRKENAIRKIGEEAEEEALAEEEEDEDELDSDVDEDDGGDDSDESDGNETDDEGGFADSDDESDDGSDYQFWTPANTTAATSVEHFEHIRPRVRRSASESSIEADLDTNGVPIARPAQPAKAKGKHARRHRRGSPELPDSTDFVCGTFDEDRPLEQAYLAHMEERRIAKQGGVLPQDVDPSFPTSDPDDGEDLDEEDEEDEDEADADDAPAWIMGPPEELDEPRGRTGHKSPAPSPPQPGRRGKSPAPAALKKSPQRRAKSPAPAALKKSPSRRAKSPAPSALKRSPQRRPKSPAPPALKRSPARRARSPAPTRLFAHSPHRAAPSSRHLRSPPASPDATPQRRRAAALAQRPHLTRTTSLPRTPNPFFHAPHGHRPALPRARTDGMALDITDADASATTTADEEPRPAAPEHSRGPIDIVQGLEQKRQRRKEKFWRMQCQKKRKEWVPPKGKGAERMRDIGLEMADRNRGYGPRGGVAVVLSV